MGPPERNWSNSFNARTAALRIFRTRSWYSASNAFPVSEFMQVSVRLRSHDALEGNRLSVSFAEVEIEHRELACLDGNVNADIRADLVLLFGAHKSHFVSSVLSALSSSPRDPSQRSSADLP